MSAKLVHHLNRQWRGVVVENEVVAWPSLLMDHKTAFAVTGALRGYTARWRQWKPGEWPDFDPGASADDVAQVENFLRHVGALDKA